MNSRISVFGLGKVGHVLATCLAHAGHTVIGYDPDPGRVAQINQRKIESFEAGIPERLAAIPPQRLSATNDAVLAAMETDVSFVIVPTPSNALNGFSLRYILAACTDLAQAIKTKTTQHIIAITSTVLPGSSDHIIVPELQALLGAEAFARTHYAYNPSFIALGEVVRGFEEPDYLLLGTHSDHARTVVSRIHSSMIRNSAPIAAMRPVEAEIAKIASNTHETMRVTFANMIMAFCEELGGANADTITTALSHRLGRRFFKGAVPYGGPCWPRDNKALSAIMEKTGISSILPQTIDTYNALHGDYVTGFVLNHTQPGDTIGLISLSYKTSAPTLDRAFGLDLARRLIKENRKVAAYDPYVGTAAKEALGGALTLHATLADLLKNTDLSVVINPVPELQKLQPEDVAAASICDPWRALPPVLAAKTRRYLPMGNGAKPMISSPQFISELKALCA